MRHGTDFLTVPDGTALSLTDSDLSDGTVSGRNGTVSTVILGGRRYRSRVGH